MARRERFHWRIIRQPHGWGKYATATDSLALCKLPPAGEKEG
ncbi:hypothetical protein SAMN05216588_11227 [Pseudomonas flavescens]|uniref:Uncharacterized protein n=1 Tax=Phytopseudomonas flavescens TaxID=29435 RepID=A0A1G8IB67_9GAMM|nr:hypothetical protein SAMN05216588_11227 [Pseudomonas flavescens]